MIKANKTQKVTEFIHQKELLLPQECRQETGSSTDGEMSQLKVQNKLWDQNWENAETPEHFPLDSQSGNACTNSDSKCPCVFRSMGNWLMIS